MCQKNGNQDGKKEKTVNFTDCVSLSFFFENVQANRISNRVALKRAEMFLWIQFMQVRCYEFYQ